jgi:hypothetical protein
MRSEFWMAPDDDPETRRRLLRHAERGDAKAVA